MVFVKNKSNRNGTEKWFEVTKKLLHVSYTTTIQNTNTKCNRLFPTLSDITENFAYNVRLLPYTPILTGK